MHWKKAHESYEQVYQDGKEPAHTSNHAHEAIAGGAAFAAFKAFEHHQRKNGKPVSHPHAKEALAGLVGAEIEKLASTKGADKWDREKAKHAARQHAEGMYDEHYGSKDQYDPTHTVHEKLAKHLS